MLNLLDREVDEPVPNKLSQRFISGVNTVSVTRKTDIHQVNDNKIIVDTVGFGDPFQSNVEI